MAIQIKKAVKYESYLRMSLAGPAGSGKTFTALTLAHALADGKGVCLIDTERGSASKYADPKLFPEFDVIELETFSPLLYIEAIKAAQDAAYGVLIIDSLSHAWNGKGGLLEMVDNIAARKYKNNTFNAWKEATPIQNSLIDALTTANLHIIATIRSKMDYLQEKNEQTGKTEIRKLGMAPIQREGLEYEFDIAVDMDISNTMIVQKSRCIPFSGQIIPKPDKRIAAILKEWLRGAPTQQPAQQEMVMVPADNTPTSQPKNGSIKRLASLYERLKEAGKIEENGNGKNYQAFYAACGKILGVTIAKPTDLTDDRLTAIEQHLSEAAQPQELPASA